MEIRGGLQDCLIIRLLFMLGFTYMLKHFDKGGCLTDLIVKNMLLIVFSLLYLRSDGVRYPSFHSAI